LLNCFAAKESDSCSTELAAFRCDPCTPLLPISRPRVQNEMCGEVALNSATRLHAAVRHATTGSHVQHQNLTTASVQGVCDQEQAQRVHAVGRVPGGSSSCQKHRSKAVQGGTSSISSLRVTFAAVVPGTFACIHTFPFKLYLSHPDTLPPVMSHRRKQCAERTESISHEQSVSGQRRMGQCQVSTPCALLFLFSSPPSSPPFLSVLLLSCFLIADAKKFAEHK